MKFIIIDNNIKLTYFPFLSNPSRKTRKWTFNTLLYSHQSKRFYLSPSWFQFCSSCGPRAKHKLKHRQMQKVHLKMLASERKTPNLNQGISNSKLNEGQNRENARVAAFKAFQASPISSRTWAFCSCKTACSGIIVIAVSHFPSASRYFPSFKNKSEWTRSDE